MKGLVGKKIGMSQLFTNDGELIPVTMIEIEPNIITQIKTVENDGYSAIQLGVENKREKVSTKAEIGHAKKANQDFAKRITKEIRISDDEVNNYELGQALTVDLFCVGEIVDIQGTSKGKGFQGAIKRHNQATGPMSHGSRYHRRPGSMGAVAPQVFKGKKLPGQMGGKTVTTQNIEVVMVDIKKNVLVVKGNVPGAKKSFVTIKNNVKNVDKKIERDLVSYIPQENESQE